MPFLPKLSQERLLDAGRRSAHMNLSDIAAMASTPRFALVQLSLPKTYAVSLVETFYQGLAEALTNDNVDVVGGNITSTAGPFAASITLGGEIPAGQSILRTGSQPGDWIGCTGYPGLAAAGLHTWMHPELPLPSEDRETLLNGYFRPTARVKEAHSLAPYLRALTDISDGFLLDLYNLLGTTQLGADLNKDSLPHSTSLVSLEQATDKPSHFYMFSPSDDYELLFTMSPEQRSKWLAQSNLHPSTPIHWLGRVTDQHNEIRLHQPKTYQALSPTGWHHF